jgi:hypothetical protein
VTTFGPYSPSDSAWEIIALVAIIAALVFIVSAATQLVRVLVPRTTAPLIPSRFAWPWVCRQGLEDLLHLKGANVRAEACAQAHALASIANRKFRAFRTALLLAAAGAGAFLVWLLFATIK